MRAIQYLSGIAAMMVVRVHAVPHSDQPLSSWVKVLLALWLIAVPIIGIYLNAHPEFLNGE